MSGRPDDFGPGGKPRGRSSVRPVRPEQAGTGSGEADEETVGERERVAARATEANAEHEGKEVRATATGVIGDGEGNEVAVDTAPPSKLDWVRLDYRLHKFILSMVRKHSKEEKAMGTVTPVEPPAVFDSAKMARKGNRAGIAGGVAMTVYFIVLGILDQVFKAWPQLANVITPDWQFYLANLVSAAVAALAAKLMTQIKNRLDHWNLPKAPTALLLCGALTLFGASGCATTNVGPNTSQNLVDAQIEFTEEDIAGCVEAIQKQEAALDVIETELLDLEGDRAENENAFAGEDKATQKDFVKQIKKKEKERAGAQQWLNWLKEREATLQNKLRDLRALSAVREPKETMVLIHKRPVDIQTALVWCIEGIEESWRELERIALTEAVVRTQYTEPEQADELEKALVRIDLERTTVTTRKGRLEDQERALRNTLLDSKITPGMRTVWVVNKPGLSVQVGTAAVMR